MRASEIPVLLATVASAEQGIALEHGILQDRTMPMKEMDVRFFKAGQESMLDKLDCFE